MKIVDKVFILFFAVIFIVLSIGMLGISFELIDMNSFIYSIKELANYKVEVGIVGLVLFLISIRVLQLLFRRKKNLKAIVANNELGGVEVTLDAINSLVKDVVRYEGEVSDIQSKVNVEERGVYVYLKLKLTAESNLPEFTKRLQNIVKDSITNYMGVDVARVEILIKEINKKKTLRVE